MKKVLLILSLISLGSACKKQAEPKPEPEYVGTMRASLIDKNGCETLLKYNEVFLQVGDKIKVDNDTLIGLEVMGVDTKQDSYNLILNFRKPKNQNVFASYLIGESAYGGEYATISMYGLNKPNNFTSVNVYDNQID
jgi:hypothetical protein